MKLLLLGGTAFLGRAVARIGRDEGFDVTCLARGSAPTVAGVRLVRADRDFEDGLAPVREQRWDAVIDVSRQPGQVRRAVREQRLRPLRPARAGRVRPDARPTRG